MESAIYDCLTPGLGFSDKISCYCERGADASLLAEPFNALSNLGFIIAALFAWRYLSQRSPARGHGILVALVAMLAVIGVGSFLFHTYASIWARIADVVPIGIFVFSYLTLALTWFVGLGKVPALLIAASIAVISLLMPPWFNGSLFYLPTLIALVALAALLQARAHAASKWVTAAAGLFFAALVLRSFDRAEFLCGGGGLGSHWAWHMINALVLYSLLVAAIDHATMKAQTKTR